MANDENLAEYNSLKKKIKQIDRKIHELDNKKKIEKKYHHSHFDTIDQEIKHLLVEKRNYLKRIKRIEKKLSKSQ